MSRLHSDEKTALQLPQRVASLVVTASQLEHLRTDAFLPPMNMRTMPTAEPIGNQTNRSAKPPTSKIRPGMEVTRPRRFVATPCSLPGSRTLLWHSGHSACAPASCRKYGKFLPQKRHRQVRISLLKRHDR